jgi:putative FmdB family regulatory protein
LPLYEYECTVCKHRFELLQKFSDKPAKVCIECGGPVIRLLSSPAIQFKGTGWYVTDYGKGGAASAGRKREKDGGDGEKSAVSSEAKPGKEPSSTSAAKPAKS